MLGWRLKFICPACGRVSKVVRAFVRAHEAQRCQKPGDPPELECHWCHQGLMVPIKYRFLSGETFHLSHHVLRAIRGRAKTPQL